MHKFENVKIIEVLLSHIEASYTDLHLQKRYTKYKSSQLEVLLMKRFDMLIIGFGKAGKTLAKDFAGQCQKVAVIEQDSNMYGGTCINVHVTN